MLQEYDFRTYCVFTTPWDGILIHQCSFWKNSLGYKRWVVSKLERYCTFNMGCGMIIAVDASVANTVCDWLCNKMPAAKLLDQLLTISIMSPMQSQKSYSIIEVEI